MKVLKSNGLAGIQYAGNAGTTRDCQDAVTRLIQHGETITKAGVLSGAQRHGFLLTVEPGNLIAVKTGFTSGYVGEGPRRFSYVLSLLDAHGVDIDEFEVSGTILDRLDMSALTTADVELINGLRPVRPTRWYDYIYESHVKLSWSSMLWDDFPPVIPFAIINHRINDLAISFWDDPDAKLLSAFRRLEDVLRERVGSKQHGVKLFEEVFRGNDAKLEWVGVGDSELVGRVELFRGAYMAYRNPRAHRERGHDPAEALGEFLLLNHLYVLEQGATERVKAP